MKPPLDPSKQLYRELEQLLYDKNMILTRCQQQKRYLRFLKVKAELEPLYTLWTKQEYLIIFYPNKLGNYMRVEMRTFINEKIILV